MPRAAEHVAVDLGQHRLLQRDLRAHSLNLVHRRIRRQWVRSGLAGDGLVHYIAEQVRPAENAARCVDDLEIEDAIVV